MIKLDKMYICRDEDQNVIFIGTKLDKTYICKDKTKFYF